MDPANVNQVKKSLLALDSDRCMEAVRSCLADGISPWDIISEGLGKGMREVGDLYLELAERHRGECEQSLSVARSRCGQRQRNWRRIGLRGALPGGSAGLRAGPRLARPVACVLGRKS